MSSKINRYTEDEASANGFPDAEIVASRSHPDGYIGTKNGVMCFNLQAEIKMGGFEYGRGSTGTIPEGLERRR